MLIFFVILLSVLLITSLVGNVIMYIAADKQMIINEMYERWISDWRTDVFKVWAHMKLLDDKQMFEKDDEVGVVFQDIKLLIKSLNDKIEDETFEE